MLVVVRYGAATSVSQEGGPSRKAEVDEERFTGFLDRVTDDADRNTLLRLSRSERQRPRLRHIVIVADCRGPVGGGVVDLDRSAARRRQGDREHRGPYAAIAFRQRHVVDGQGRQRIVVQDRAYALG